ncbi:MAG: hypothetical protein ACP5DC_03905 [Halothiobacillaceae bacterium]
MKKITLQTLLGTLILGLTAFFWWLPAPQLMQVTEIDLGAWHAERMGPQREIGLGLSRFTGMPAIRKPETAFLPLAEFADRQFEKPPARVDAQGWQQLVSGRAGLPADDARNVPEGPAFWLPVDAPVFEGASSGFVSVAGAGDLTFFRFRALAADDLWDYAIPPSVQFPWRSIPLAVAALLVGFALLWFGRARGLADSSVARGLRLSLSLLILFGLLYLYLLTGAVDNMDIKYAMILVSIPLVLTTALAIIWLSASLRRLRRLINGEGLWADWELNKTQWHGYLEARTARQTARHKVMLASLGGIMIAVAALYVAFAPDRDGTLWVVVTLAVVFGLALLAAFFVPLWTRHRLAQAEHRVWIGEGGALVGNQYFRWAGLGARPRQACLVKESASLFLIELSFEQTQAYFVQGNPIFYKQEHRVWVPVPVELRDQGQAVVDRLSEFFGLNAESK